MSDDTAERRRAWGPRQLLRVGWAAASVFVVESLLIGMALLPASVFYQWHLRWAFDPWWIRGVLVGAAVLPAYLIFALLLMWLSATATRVLGWRPPPDRDLRIAEVDPELCDWARYAIVNHVVRHLVGTALRATPMWTWYLRWNGATIGHRVWVNSLDVTDHCLLTLGDDVVIGAGAHVSAHTVERGIVRTAPIVLGAGTTVGVDAIVQIGVETGPRCTIGALSMVPKRTRLDGHTTYVGVPVHPIEGHVG